MPKIIQMDAKLANMIAAGEVVNRPASVLKELIENSIDAKSTQIMVEIYDMGMSKIAVTDNGDGMEPADAKTAFLRHATSKIRSETDLSHINTLGFRGEALAAIASVSKICLKTRQRDFDGFQVVYEAGKLVSEGSAQLNIGTSVIVSDLFYNTPARFKYIKSELAEKAALIDIFDRLALSHPLIAFKLYMDNHLIKETFGKGDYTSLIDQIYGKQVTKDLTKFEKNEQKIHITGYLVSPSISRSRKKDISIFINGRYVKNYALIQAVIDGYQGFLMINRYPIALIHLHMDPSLVDANVHPQKFEVKLINESLLSFTIEQHIKSTFKNKTHQILEVHKSLQNKEKIIPMTLDDYALDESKNLFLNDDKAHFNHEEQSFSSESKHQNKIPDFDYVGIFSGTYLLFQNKDGLFMVDQHAAQERIRYEYYHQVLKHPKKIKKDMFIPKKLDLSLNELSQIDAYAQEFLEIGFQFNTYHEIIAIPTWLKDDEMDRAVESILMMLNEKQKIDLSILRDHLAKDISCKGSIKANQAINRLEIEQLIKDLKTCENPYTCPHGRPTVIKLTHYEIEKMFKRIV